MAVQKGNLWPSSRNDSTYAQSLVYYPSILCDSRYLCVIVASSSYYGLLDNFVSDLEY